MTNLLSEYKQCLHVTRDETLETLCAFTQRQDIFTHLHYELFSSLLRKYSNLLSLSETNKNGINSYLQSLEWYTCNRYKMTISDINDTFTLNMLRSYSVDHDTITNETSVGAQAQQTLICNNDDYFHCSSSSSTSTLIHGSNIAGNTF